MSAIIGRRGFIAGLAAALAAPSIVRSVSLMPVRGIVMDIPMPPTGVLWQIAAMGNFLYSDELSDVLRVQVVPLTEFSRLTTAGPSPLLARDIRRAAA